MSQQLVAVYGSLRRGLGNHQYFLGNAPLLGTFREHLEGYMVSMGGFPAIKKDVFGQQDITYEVYQVDDQQLDRLDSLEGHPTWYRRELIDTPVGKAWIYWMLKDVSNRPLVEDGDWVNYLKEVG